MSSTAPPKNSSARAGALVFTSLTAVLAAAGGWLVWHLLTSSGYDREPMRPVVVAKEPIGAGHPLRAEDLRVVPWPSSAVPEGAFSDIAMLLKPTPAVPTGGFVTGEPILKERLASPEAGPGLSALVVKESRAITVQVDRALAVAHLVYPGAHVDVLATLEDRVHGIYVTRTVLEDVRVLAVGTFADVDAARRGAERQGVDADAVVTLEVGPAEAERLALAARQGKLDLALRNATDRSRASTPGVAFGELLTGSAPGPATALIPQGAAPTALAPPLPPSSSSRHRSGNVTTAAAPSPTVRSNPRPASGTGD